MLAAVALAAAGGLWLVRLWRTRDERRVRRTVARMAELFGKAGTESELISLARASEITQSLAAGFRIELGPPFREHVADRDLLRLAIHQARSQADRISVAVLDHSVELAPGRQQARSEVAVRVRADAGGESDNEMRRFALTWVKQGGAWLIMTVRLADTIEAPR